MAEIFLWINAIAGLWSQGYGFSSSHVPLWELDHREGWKLNWCFQLCCWRRLLRVPWTAKKSTPNIHWKDWCWSWSSDTLALDVKSCFSGKGYWESTWYWESVPFLALSTVTAGHWLSPWASLFHQRGTTLPTHSLSRGRRTKEAVIDRGIVEVKDGWTRHALKMLLTLKVYGSLIEKINSNK